MSSELISAEIPPTDVPRSSNAFSIRFFQSIFFIIPVMQLNICSPRLIQSIFVIKFLRKSKIPFIILPTNVEKFISIPSTSILFTNSASLLPLLLKLIVCSNSAAVLKPPLIPSENACIEYPDVRVTRYIAGFTAGLFGTTYKQAAEATQKLKNTGKTATDTAKKVNLSLAGIDEMNILSDNSDESENNEENSGIDFSNLDMSEPKLPDWAERLKEAIKSGDWYGVGEVLAERINAIFDSIDWENTEKKVTDGVNKILDLINGFADNLDFQHLGNTFAGGLNTISSVVNAFSDNIHWETIGSELANGLNQAVNKIEWEQLGRSMSLNIRILTNLFYNFVTEFDWINLGKNISKAVNGWFNGGNLGSDISRLLKSIPEFSLLFSDSSELSERIFISSIPASDRFTFLAVSVAVLPVFLSFCVASAACL